MQLLDKSVLIVGGTKGIGAASARAASEAGAKVRITGRTDTSLAAALSSLPEDVTGIRLDYTDRHSVEAFAEGIDEIDCLILTASSTPAWGPFTSLSEESVRAAFEAKFWGYWRVIKALEPKLASNGSITLVTGAAARAALHGTSGLAAVNGALEAMTKVLAVELGPRRVNSVAPGMTDTEAYAGMPQSDRDQFFAASASKLPVRRIGKPADVAQAILTIAANEFITGTTFDIDGGAHLAR